MNFNFDGVSKQQIEELMRSLGAGTLQQTDTDGTATHVVIQDTSEQLEKKQGGFEIDPSMPILLSPSLQLMKNPGILTAVAQNAVNAGRRGGSDTDENVALPPEIAALFPDTGEGDDLLKLADAQPGVRALMILTNGDASKVSNLLSEYLENENILTMPPATHPTTGKAVEYALSKVFAEMGIPFPEDKGESVQQGMQILRFIENFCDFLPTIDPAGKSMMSGSGLEKYMKITDAMAAQNNEAIKQLQLIPDQLDPGKIKQSTFEFLQFISSVIADLRQTLTQIQIQDQSRSGDISVAQMKAIDMKQEYVEKQLEGMREKLKMADTGAFMKKFMKMLTPIMGSSMICISIIMIIMTGPAGLIALAASVVVFAIQTTLDQTGCLDSAFKAINKALDSVGKGLKYATWITVILALVVIIVVCACAPQMAGVLLAILMPILTVIIQQSGVITDIMGDFSDAVGGGQTVKMVLQIVGNLVVNMGISFVVSLVKQIAGIIWQLVETIISFIVFTIPSIIIAIIMLVISIILAVCTCGVGTIIFLVIVLVICLIVNVILILAQILKILIQVVLTGAVEQLLGVIMLLLNLILLVLQQLLKIIDIAMDFVKGLLEFIMKKVQLLLEIIKKLVTIIKKVITMIIEILQKIKEIITMILNVIVTIIKLIIDVVQQGIAVLMALFEGAIKLKMAELVDQQAHLDEMVDLLSKQIKILGDLAQEQMGQDNTSQQGGVNKFWEQCQQLARLFEKIVKSYSGITADIASSAT